LQADTNSVATYVAFVEYDVGGHGELSFYADPQQTSTLDALAQLANLHVHIWQNAPEAPASLILRRQCGQTAGTMTHLHHRAGLNTHFQLLSVVIQTADLGQYSHTEASAAPATNLVGVAP
jgi:hypothetical protein